jgi:hypothetical protein
VPSGRVSWLHFLPLATAAVIVSIACAYALFLLERSHYFLVLTALLLALPVLAIFAASIYLGRCRNPVFAAAFGALLMTCLYCGLWGFSYHFNIAIYGPGAQRWLRETTGQDGILGYLVIRCRYSPRGATFRYPVLETISVAMRGLEFGVLLALGIYLGRRMARRVYFEDHDKWANSVGFLFDPIRLDQVIGIVRRGAWPELDQIDKEAVSGDRRRAGSSLFRIEYLPRSSDQPAYITIEGAILGRFSILLAIVPPLGRLARRHLTQFEIDADSLQALSKHVGGLDLQRPSVKSAQAPADSAPSPGEAIGYWGEDQAIAHASAVGAVHSMISESGLVPGPLVQPATDFREAAVGATAAIIGRWPESGLEGIEGVDASLCARAESNVQKVLRGLSALQNVVAYVFLIGSLIFSASLFVNLGFTQSGNMAMASLSKEIGTSAGAAAWGLYLVVAVAYRPIQKWRLLRRFRRRGGSLLGALPAGKLELVNLEDAATFHITKFTPEDWCLCRVDAANRRLLLEGISHRYVIRGSDVTALHPARSSQVNVMIRYRVGPEELGLVMARPNMGRSIVYGLSRFPLFGWPLRPLMQRSSPRFARRLARALRFQEEPKKALQLTGEAFSNPQNSSDTSYSHTPHP